MPQEQHVVRCYACKKFQVQIVKKVAKWQCKVCTAKQSLLKVYAQGSGKECRQHVQNLNMQQGLMSEETPDTTYYESTSHFEDQPFTDNPVIENKASKWSEYLDDSRVSQAKLNSWEGEETPDNIPRTNVSAGRKRKLSNQDDYEDYSTYETYEQSWQPEAEVLDLSSGPCASDILKDLNVKSAKTKNPVSPQPKFSGFTSTKSKWSQFVSPIDKTPAMSNDENPETLSNNSVRQKFNPTATTFKASVPFDNSNSEIVANNLSLVKENVTQNQFNDCISFGYDLSSKKERKLTSSTSSINPFCTVNDDDNLDTLLEF